MTRPDKNLLIKAEYILALDSLMENTVFAYVYGSDRNQILHLCEFIDLLIPSRIEIIPELPVSGLEIMLATASSPISPEESRKNYSEIEIRPLNGLIHLNFHGSFEMHETGLLSASFYFSGKREYRGSHKITIYYTP